MKREFYVLGCSGKCEFESTVVSFYPGEERLKRCYYCEKPLVELFKTKRIRELEREAWQFIDIINSLMETFVLDWNVEEILKDACEKQYDAFLEEEKTVKNYKRMYFSRKKHNK